MVDNRYATALVIGSVLSLLATVYLSVANWYQYRMVPATNSNANSNGNTSELVKEFIHGDLDEKAYSDTMFLLNGTLGLWWRCIMVPSETHWYKEPDPKMASQCVSFTLPHFASKYKEPGNEKSGEDLLRTYMWRCQFLLPLVSLALVFLSSLVGVCACLCRSVTPTLGVGVLHLLAGVDLLHRSASPPEAVDRTAPGWSRVPGTHLLAGWQMMAARALPVGGRCRPPQELHAHDSVPAWPRGGAPPALRSARQGKAKAQRQLKPDAVLEALVLLLKRTERYRSNSE
ncbi:Claudin domain-containing protein 1 [Merluccius polli]|uniref:Claudin domain-containing protein 1 n=1 Tax=Merluccius polli TaxID=89951 RepID=A0AA47MDL3_MERPO|nr:Claudin domain-containing protein 1 [Merluccius polli]